MKCIENWFEFSWPGISRLCAYFFRALGELCLWLKISILLQKDRKDIKQYS